MKRVWCLNSVLDCIDALSWEDGFEETCTDYGNEYCENGRFKTDYEHYCGSTHNFPEENCCSCGKNRGMFQRTTSIHLNHIHIL